MAPKDRTVVKVKLSVSLTRSSSSKLSSVYSPRRMQNEDHRGEILNNSSNISRLFRPKHMETRIDKPSMRFEGSNLGIERGNLRFNELFDLSLRTSSCSCTLLEKGSGAQSHGSGGGVTITWSYQMKDEHTV